MNHQPKLNCATLFCAIVGPTASGKSSLAMQLATSQNCPIVNVDSMQVYRGLDVGTAKPSKSDQEQVKHYGLDLVEPTERFSAERYNCEIEPVLETAWNQKKPLILCGGTGLYFRALLEGFIQTPDPDMDLRARLTQQAEEQGCETFYKELEKVDPEAASSVHPNDIKRIIRALEIYYQTGKPFSEHKHSHPRKKWMNHTRFIGLHWNRKELCQRIEQRTRWMFEHGLVDETKWMLSLGCAPYFTAMQALGYKECMRYVNGEITKEEAEVETILHTVQYAKRQMTWFRHQFPVHWIESHDKRSEKDLLEECLQIW